MKHSTALTAPFRDDRPREECGVVAVSSPGGEETAQLAFFALFALQHRGQSPQHGLPIPPADGPL
jgi:amidophosphoribosyltransferase